VLAGRIASSKLTAGVLLMSTCPAFLRWLPVFILAGLAVAAPAQTAYFVDGYHGGVYGHYPTNFTRFIVDSLRANPEWRLNLEIEPATWDFVKSNTPDAYAEFKELAADQSVSGRIEFINPAYAQSYLWNISGESIIQQFVRGREKIREHFANAQFTTYSSEEPCFTSALPGILNSLGIKNAVLKNPDTCWGGYTRAFGGELVNWIGPDGTAIKTVPRYAMESLKENSTWETIANDASPEFIQGALRAGIEHPVGMCIQDAGWRIGPWLKRCSGGYEPIQFTTWRNYFQNMAPPTAAEDWRLSQEDVRVSLVWGAQVLQRIAQEERNAESRVIAAEKMATLAGVYRQAAWPEASLDEAWRTLMLSQHHDCWIVPYNGERGHTWADQVATWTGNTVQRSDEIIRQSAQAFAEEPKSNSPAYFRVFNTLGLARTDIACVALPENWQGEPRVRDGQGRTIPSQTAYSENGAKELNFRAAVPAMGYATFKLESTDEKATPQSLAFTASDGSTVLQNDLYRLELDPLHGGTIRSLLLKEQGNRQLVDTGNARQFNELRGYFWAAGKFLSTAENPAKIEVLENGPVRASVRIRGQLGSNAVTQVITLVQGQRRIDFNTRIDWQGSPDVGEDFEQSGGFQPAHDHKAFYDDRYKLLALFPVNLPRQQIYKNAPFDVTQSGLTDTFFDTWSGIKNNVLLNWVDVYDVTNNMGLALLSDHTTSYGHGGSFPLALTLQYSGVGLWGREYTLRGLTEVNYALVPHAGNWEQAGLWAEDDRWNEPLHTETDHSGTAPEFPKKSLLSFDRDGWEVPSMRLQDGKVFIRLFNASSEPAQRNLVYDGPVVKAELVQLNGEVLREIPVTKDERGRAHYGVALPRFGVGTLRITP
jgi:alpha-mannosidase